MVKSQENNGSSTSGEPSDQIADMLNSISGIDTSKEHQSEAESDKEVAKNAAEQEIVLGPVEIFPDMAQENIEGNGLQSTELAVEPVSLQEIQTTTTEVKQVHVSMMETEEPEPQDQLELEAPIFQFLEELTEVKNGTETTSSPESETSTKDQSSPKHSSDHSLDVNGDSIAEIRMEPKSRDDDSEKLHWEERCFNSEIPLLASEETETLEPPVKKRLRRRMGMCGLGDRKRKFPFDGQHCRQGFIGRQMEEGNKDLLHRSALENDVTTPMDHQETTSPACEENQGVLKEDSGAEEIDTERRTGKEENRLRNVSEGIAVKNDERTADESHQGSGDFLEKGMLEEKNGTVIMDSKGTAGELVLEDISTVVERTLLRPTIGKIPKMIQGETSVPASDNDFEKETAVCDVEPNVPGKMIDSGQDIEFNLKHDVLHEQDIEFNLKHLHADAEVDEEPEEPSSKVQGATVEMSKGSVTITKESREALTDMGKNEMEIEEHCPSNMATFKKPGPHGPEAGGPTEECLNPFVHVDIMSITTIASSDIQTAGGPGGNDQLATGVFEITEPPGGDADDSKGILDPTAPPAGQELHLHSLLDKNSPETPVTPSAFEQHVHNSTLTPAGEELPQETCPDLCVPSSVFSMTDSQIHKIALSMDLNMEPEDESVPENHDHQEDATELVRGLVRELSSLNRTVMAAHREMELVRHGKPLNRRHRGPRHAET
ncbi:uncharacterized protein LOC124378352 [Silurus meridionalis]|uniref:Uncharacterized protein n=1 Tax=Silurus meridionalis TaxID=175797 RepID=A0A8T0AD03_SILME|nr:uncharacterized protein LOC124378352 [Silurus meridionalis]XP_046693925.1 uncharacterized protein LOC124378352 [Silurus meridionalis]XP_046693927.1 uncharacterized protein LOC124378352 [Silurus meridionalis]XP_046693928.1 uncharacterized protein LOC124378352 [Silurus meridionalis]KAF7689285.1 hypothetical protein HF521_012638 [Silurus meridionalis]